MFKHAPRWLRRIAGRIPTAQTQHGAGRELPPIRFDSCVRADAIGARQFADFTHVAFFFRLRNFEYATAARCFWSGNVLADSFDPIYLPMKLFSVSPLTGFGILIDLLGAILAEGELHPAPHTAIGLLCLSSEHLFADEPRAQLLGRSAVLRGA